MRLHWQRAVVAAQEAMLHLLGIYALPDTRPTGCQAVWPADSPFRLTCPAHEDVSRSGQRTIDGWILRHEDEVSMKAAA